MNWDRWLLLGLTAFLAIGSLPEAWPFYRRVSAASLITMFAGLFVRLVEALTEPGRP